MFEEQTYEVILERILARVPDTFDKREGSIIYDAIAPAAAELAQAYISLDSVMSESFADTESREYLIRRAAERGLSPSAATAAKVKGVFTPTTVEIPIGNRFSCDALNYTVTEKTQAGQYILTCETSGSAANGVLGSLIPIEYVSGLETAEITEILIPGEDEEDTEVFRTRYFASFDSQAFGGNVTDYKNKTNAISGVGATKVTPIWNGAGTVKLTIIDSEYAPASSELVSTVQETIDPTQDASGKGLAPIGHIVTVVSAAGVTINVSSTFTFDEDYSFAGLKSQIENTISAYLLELRKAWADSSYLIVRIAQIDARLLDIEGILDISGTKINGTAANLTLENEEVPTMGEVSENA